MFSSAKTVFFLGPTVAVVWARAHYIWCVGCPQPTTGSVSRRFACFLGSRLFRGLADSPVPHRVAPHGSPRQRLSGNGVELLDRKRPTQVKMVQVDIVAIAPEHRSIIEFDLHPQLPTVHAFALAQGGTATQRKQVGISLFPPDGIDRHVACLEDDGNREDLADEALIDGLEGPCITDPCIVHPLVGAGSRHFDINPANPLRVDAVLAAHRPGDRCAALVCAPRREALEAGIEDMKMTPQPVEGDSLAFVRA